jgi:hypothetical protein
VLDLNGASAGTDYTALFTENGPAVAIAGTAVLITDDDDTELNRATITIDNPLPGDELIVNEAGLPPGVVVHSTSTTTEVVLIGTASPADYQVAIQQVHFQSASETPGASRAVQVVVYDSQAPSNTAITTITIDQAPDAVDDSSFTQIDTAVITGNVLVNDDHGDGPATITAFDAVSVQGGSVINNGDGTFVYTPLAGFTGTDTFHYTIGDQDGDESTAEVSITVTDSSGLLNPVVVAIHDLAAQGIPEPSGLAYDPATGKMFLSDAEIDESPTFDLADLFVFSLDGVKEQSITPGFTDEPTGLALDPTQDLLFISDDDEREIFVVDPANPTTALWSFGTSTIGAADPEDVAVDSANGHLFIMSGTDRTIVETDYTGTQVFSTIVLPSEISDPEALAFDPVENVFYVGGGFSYMIWKVDLGGNILEELDLLVDYRNPINNTRVHVKDIELAPASDGSGETHIYVADFGNSHVMDGRLFEIDPYDATAAPDFATSDADDLFII